MVQRCRYRVSGVEALIGFSAWHNDFDDKSAEPWSVRQVHRHQQSTNAFTWQTGQRLVAHAVHAFDRKPWPIVFDLWIVPFDVSDVSSTPSRSARLFTREAVHLSGAVEQRKWMFYRETNALEGKVHDNRSLDQLERLPRRGRQPNVKKALLAALTTVKTLLNDRGDVEFKSMLAISL